MNATDQKSVSVTMTCQELLSLAACSCRMPGYADPDGSRLISIKQSREEIPVRQILERECIGCSCTGCNRPCRKEKHERRNKSPVFLGKRM